MAGEIKRADETIGSYAFMLADGGVNGCASASPFAPRLVTGTRDYQDYDPFSAVGFSDLSGGMGQERAEDVTRYMDAVNADCRGGRIILGPLTTYSEASPTGLEADSTTLLTGGFLGSAALGPLRSNYTDDSTTAVPYTTMALRIVPPAGVTKIRRVWLPLGIGHSATAVQVRLFSDHAVNHVPDAEVAVATVAAADYRPFGHWVQAVFAADQVVVAGTAYWIAVKETGQAKQCVWYGSTVVNTADDNHVKVQRTAAPNDWLSPSTWKSHLLIWYDNPDVRPDGPLTLLTGAGEDGATRIWGWFGQRLWYLNAAGTLTVVEKQSADPANHDPQPMGGGTVDATDAVWWQAAADTYAKLYVAFANGLGANIEIFDGNIGSEGWGNAGTTGHALAVHDSYLWRADDANEVSASADGTNFGTAISVGDKSYLVRKMVSWNGALWVGKDDGLYKVERPASYPTSGVPTCIKVIDLITLADPNNFSLMVTHQGDLIFSAGHGLLRYTTGNVLTPITPDVGMERSSAERSLYRGACSSVNALWVVAEGPFGSTAGTAGKSSLLAYIEGHWHPVATMARYADMMRSVVMEPGWFAALGRIWFAAGLTAGYVKMSADTQRRWDVVGADYADSGYVDLSWVDGGIFTIDKDWIRVDVDTRDTGVPGYVQVFWRSTDTGSWVQLGSNITVPGIQTVAFPAASWGCRCQIRVKIVRIGVSTTTPQVLGVVVKYMERPTDYQTFTRTYLLGRSPWRSGIERTTGIGAQLAVLSTLRNAQEPVTWVPVWGGSGYTVHVIEYSTQEVREYTEDLGDTLSIRAVVKLAVLP